jgi:hypothetical protein
MYWISKGDAHPHVISKRQLWVKFAIPTFILFFFWLCIQGELFMGWNMPFCEITGSLHDGTYRIHWLGDSFNEHEAVKIVLGGAFILTILTGIEWILYNRLSNSIDLHDRIRKKISNNFSSN